MWKKIVSSDENDLKVAYLPIPNTVEPCDTTLLQVIKPTTPQANRMINLFALTKFNYLVQKDAIHYLP